MAGIIGKKIGMTSVFSVEGKNIPCTVIEAGPCVITQVKTEETDGYGALQLAYGDKKEKHTTKAELGHFKHPRKRLLSLQTPIRKHSSWDKKLMLMFFMKMIMLMLKEFQKEKVSRE